MTFDIIVYQTAFQERVLEPVTTAGRTWCNWTTVNDQISNYEGEEKLFVVDNENPDNTRACLIGFDTPGTFACKRRDFDHLFAEATRAGLILGDAGGNRIIRADA